MHREGHVGAALLVYAPLGTWLAGTGYPGAALLGAATMIAFASVPDVDERLPLVAHRGVTHTFLFALAFGGALGLVGLQFATAVPKGSWGPTTPARFGFLLGTLSVLTHVAADALTPMGVAPLWPLSRSRISLSLTRAANPVANYALLVAGVLASGAGLLVAAG